MDKIFIRKLQIFTIIGIYEWEKKIKQKLLVNIEAKPIQGHKWDLNNYLDYSKLSKAIIQKTENKQFLLIEEIAEFIAKIVINDFNAYWVRIKICKPFAVLKAKETGIVIERTKSFQKIDKQVYI